MTSDPMKGNNVTIVGYSEDKIGRRSSQCLITVQESGKEKSGGSENW